MSQQHDPDQSRGDPPLGAMSPTLWCVVGVVAIFLIGMFLYTHWPQPPRTPAVTSHSPHASSLAG